MLRILVTIAVLFLAACGSDEAAAPRVSPAAGGDPVPQGMNYREYAAKHGDGSIESQKRFLMLDRDNNGHLSESELGNYGDY